MQIASFHITNFRSIEDSGVVPIGRVSCLVGKNESGKTNFLQALVRVNAAPGQPTEFDINDDYPRRGLTDIEADLKRPGFVYPVVARVTYRLSEDEVSDLSTRFGPNTVKLGEDFTATVSLKYDGTRRWNVSVSEPAAIDHLLEVHRVKLGAAKPKSIAKLLEMAPESNIDLSRVVESIGGWPGNSLWAAVRARLKEFEPLYVYFDDYARMAGEGNVRELLTLRASGDEVDPSKQTFLALIDEAKIDLDDLANLQYNALRNRLESASIRISEELYAYWSQNQNSGIDFDHTYEQDPEDPQGRGDLILKVRVEDKRHGVSVPIDRRSNGFVWFFSFLVNFAQIRAQYPGRPLVLLLDEPGTALHGLAQRDFLKVLDGPLAEHQILYTTHQPFLVDPDRLDRARPVVETKETGTRVYEHAYRVDSDTLFPLQAALGYEIGQTLFVAPNVLLVEGTSDLIYLQFLSRACELNGKTGLNPRWTITPVGGVDKMDTFVRLFKGQQLNICAFIDATGNKLTKVEKLVRDGHLEAEQLIKVSDAVQVPEADIEDVFDPAFYLDLVRGVGQEDTTRPIYNAITATQLPDQATEPRITRRIDSVLETFSQPRLDHLPPALYLDRHRDELLRAIDEATIERASKIFEAVNGQLRA